ncbi:DUF2860 domain-containing protein [bacterium]|nr:MAG: DUF2860 domain-containing protein [bacterium]
MTTIHAAVLAALVGAPAFAQTVEDDAARAAREAQTRTEAQETAAEAKARRPVEGAGEVTYEDVLKNPDDVELNYRWAKKQIEAGDLKGASATLERILMVKPGLTKVRLTFAVVLFRLDSIPEARRELEAVKRQASGAVAAEAADYLRRVEARERRTHAHGMLGVGYAWDTNRNAGPASDQRLLRGTALNLTTGRAKDDTSVVFLAQAGVRRDLRRFPGSTFGGDFTYYRAEQTNLNTLDLQAYSFSVGPSLRLGRTVVSPAAVFDHIRLSEETYLRTRGARVKAERRVNKTLTLNASLAAVFNEHIRTSDVPTAVERTGNETTLTGGAQLTFSPTQRVNLSAGYQQRDARKMYNAYDRHSFGLTHSWLLGKGRFLLSGLNLDVDRYRAPDLAIANQERADDKARLSLTFGQPLSPLGKLFEPFLFTASYEYLQVNSNILNYAYTNNKVSGMLTYRWDY